jgi:hypothetical protein
MKNPGTRWRRNAGTKDYERDKDTERPQRAQARSWGIYKRPSSALPKSPL